MNSDPCEAPYKEGALTWNMSMQYSTDITNPAKAVSIGEITMKFVIDASGKMAAVKAGISAETVPNQKTSAAIIPQ